MVTRDRSIRITDTHLIVGHTYEVAVAARDRDGRVQSFDEAPRAVVRLVGRSLAPSPPTGLAASTAITSVFLSWTLPSDTDIEEVTVWRNTVDDRDSATQIASVKGSAYTDNLGAAGLTRYYWVRLLNRTLVESDWNAVAGVEATTAGVVATDIDDFAITATKFFTKTVVLTGDTWTANSPSAGKVAWNSHTLVYNGVAYAITGSNTSNKYIYWVVGGGTYSTSATHPTLGTTGFMIATNVSGVPGLVWNSSANMVIGSAYIADAAITNAKINDLSADKINTGTLNAAVVSIANLTVGNAQITDLSADKLTAGTITGSVLQTATTGNRIKVNVSDNSLKAYLSGTTDPVANLTANSGYGGALLDIGGLSAKKGGAVIITKSDTGGDSTLTLTHHLIQLGTYGDDENPGVYVNKDHSVNTFAVVTAIAPGGYIFAGGSTFSNFTVNSDGDVNTVTKYCVDGTQVVSNRGAAVADATGTGDVVAQLNALLARLRTHGLIAT